MGYNKKRPYRLIITCNNKQYESVGSFTTEIKALKAMHQIAKENEKKIIFPKKYITTNLVQEAKFHLVLIKKRDENDPSINLVKNEYGEYVEHESNNPLWLIVDKLPYNIEEEFWVYGYHPMTDRKNFDFIFDELVMPYAVDRSKGLNIQIFKNKVLFESLGHMDLVLCKNQSDAIRLYNLLNEKCQNTKSIKYVLFLGDGDSTLYSKHSCVEKIKELTNWNEKKIKRAMTKTWNGNKNKKLED